MRIAAIDLGSNSIHMIVVRVHADLSFEVIDREKEMVRLGAGGLDGGRLTPEAMSAALDALSRYRRLAESHAVDQVLAAATSAVREAENGGEFLIRVERETGLRVNVISALEEARLIHLAAVYGTSVGSRRAVVIDIGGGSVEITLGTAARPTLARSFKIGVIRLAERFVKSDPLSRANERKLVRHVLKQAREYLDEIAERGYDRVIGTSGTILSLGALAAGADGANNLRNVRVSAKAIHRVRERLSAMTMQQRVKQSGLDPRRADIAVPGSILLDTLLDRLGARELTLSDFALREGLVLDYIRRNTSTIRELERYPDVRKRSVIELAARCRYVPEHARHVARLAVDLFDRTRRWHKLGPREREWLEFAALLHDIGVHISYERHHRHSYYLIRNGGLRGFEPEEVEAIALVARYHRRGAPKRTDPEYGRLGRPLRKTVRVLSSLVRMAEGLDRTRNQAIAGVDVIPEDGRVRLQLHANGDAELEAWAAQRQAPALEGWLGRPVFCELVNDGAAQAGAGRESDGQHADNTASVSRQAVRRRRHRRVGKDDAARPARQVAHRRRPPRLRDRVELLGAGQGGHQGRQEKEPAHADDVQPAARHRFR
jgi:exopolyphosphatase/guanosine-5'-triphosphate,3'-diphosphate pyrophosphatase